MKIVAFDPARQALRVLDRDFLLVLNLRADSTGVARLYEVAPDGVRAFLGAFVQLTPGAAWHIGSGHGRTPREAAWAHLVPKDATRPVPPHGAQAAPLLKPTGRRR